MGLNRKGFYFSFDALLAAMVILAMFFAVTTMDTTNQVETTATTYRQADSLAEDSVQVLMSSSFRDALTAERRGYFLNATSLDEEDMNSSVMDAVAILWASNETDEARNLSRQFLSGIVPDRFDFRVRMQNNGSDVIYATSDTFDNASLVSRSSRMVSGVSRNRPTSGFIASASLTDLDAVKSEYFFFGGYVGDGNITANVTLPEHRNVVETVIEGDFNGNFSLSINGNASGSYQASGAELSADNWTICSPTFQSQRCGFFEAGDNTVRFDFAGNGSSIGGGFVRVDYNQSESLETTGDRYSTRRKQLPGIDGLINLFSSFYVPGTLQGIETRLHYSTNRTFFVKIGNATVYRNTTFGQVDIMLDNETLSSELHEDNRSLEEFSNATIPLRIGVENLTDLTRRNADAVSVLDVSGSMQGTGNEKPMDEAQNASKEFSDLVLNVSGNRVGLTAFENDVDAVHELTTNDTSMEQTIDSLSAGGSICIGCGVLRATEVVDTPFRDSIVDRRSDWKWNASFPASEPPVRDGRSWEETDYSANWQENWTILGGGAQTVDTFILDNGGNYFFRKVFRYDTDLHRDPAIYVRSDDAAEVYLNGKLIDNDTEVHEAEYWNRITGSATLEGLLWRFADGFERANLGENWTVTDGNEGDEVLVSDACGAAEGSEATVLRWGGGVMESDFGLASDEFVSSINFSFRQGGDDGPTNDCENPEAGDDVYFQYVDRDGKWRTLKAFDGGGSDPAEGSWDRYEFTVPTDGLHEDFRFRFSYPSGSGSDSDYWAFDDLSIAVKEGEAITSINNSDMNDGKNVIAAKVKNRNVTEEFNTSTDANADWESGTLHNTTFSQGELYLEHARADGGTDVDTTSYCSVSGGDTDTNGEYITNVEMHGIDRDSGNDGGYLDATDSVSRPLVPGRMYNVSVLFHTSGFNEHGSVVFDWDGDGQINNDNVHEIGSCSSGNCTVSTRVTVPNDAATGSTLMRVMGEYNEYHTKPCQDQDYNEMEDYSVFVAAEEYRQNGTYTSKRFDAGGTVDWNTSSVTADVPAGTEYSINYTDTEDWYGTIDQVPDSRFLRFNLSLSSEDPSITPSIDEVNISYRTLQTEFDLSLNASTRRKGYQVVMSSGKANTETSMEDVPDHNNDGTVDALDHAIEAACRANEDHNVTVHTIGFRSDADNDTLQRMANCADGNFYFASSGNLEEVFEEVAQDILEATIEEQRITVTEGEVGDRLFADSYIDLNYSSPQRTEFGKFRITQESDRFGGSVSSPKNGSFDVPAETELLDARLLSYSSNFWTDRVTIQNTTGVHEYVYRLWKYGDDYTDLGDPYTVHIPPSKATAGARNNVSVDTAVNRSATRGGSNFSRVVYDLLVDGFVGYGDVFNRSRGGNTTVQTDYGSFDLSVGDMNDTWVPNSDAVDNATERLLAKLDTDNDGVVDVQIDSSNLNIDQNSLSGLKWLWGPAIVSVEVWE